MTRHRIAVFASGSGTNFEALALACRDGRIARTDIVLCVCDRPGAGVEERARRLAIPLLSTHPRCFESKAAFEAFIARTLNEAAVELVCLAGYMRIVGPTLLQAYAGRIINIHPALLPSFPGAHGIDDAFDYGVKISGVTIHYVDSGIDTGRIIAQAPVPVPDDRDRFEAEIHRTEHLLYPATVNALLNQQEQQDNNIQ